MTFEEALPLVQSLSSDDKLRLIDELARALLAERQATSASPPSTAGSAARAGQPDEVRWTAWLDSLLDAGADRIAAAQREMRARGILDDAGNLATSALPADMRAGSKTSVTTG